MFGITIPSFVSGNIVWVQAILLFISAILIIIASVGILRLDKNMPNVVYARIHILGIIDIAGVIGFLGLGQPLFALIYLILAPLLAHAMSNAYFHTEDDYNNSIIKNNDCEELSSGSDLAADCVNEFVEEESEDIYSISTLEIKEDE